MFSNVLRLSFPGKLFVDQGSDCGPVCVSFICGSLSLSRCLSVCLSPGLFCSRHGIHEETAAATKLHF